MRTRALLVFAFVLAGCGQDFSPYSLASGLRLLAVQAEPPEIGAPGSGLVSEATLRSLVADPVQLDDPPACGVLPRPLGETCTTATVLHLACTPDPDNLAFSSCTSLATLRDPAAIGADLSVPACEPGSTAPLGQGVPGGVTVVGIEECDQALGCRPAAVRLDETTSLELPPPTFSLPPDYSVDGLPEGEFARRGGLEVVIFSVAFRGSVQELIGGRPVANTCEVIGALAPALAAAFEAPDTILAVKRLDIRGPDADEPVPGEAEVPPPNENPRVLGVLADGLPISAEPLVVQRAQGLVLLPRPPPGVDALFQTFRRLGDDCEVLESDLREAWLVTWFVTAGDVSPNRAENFDETIDWVAPKGNEQNFGEDVPESGRVFVYVVVRDRRGGIDWAVGELCIAGFPCDPAAP